MQHGVSLHRSTGCNVYSRCICLFLFITLQLDARLSSTETSHNSIRRCYFSQQTIDSSTLLSIPKILKSPFLFISIAIDTTQFEKIISQITKTTKYKLRREQTVVRYPLHDFPVLRVSF